MVLPVFYTRMFDFGDQPVPEHVDDDTEWFETARGTWTLFDGPDPDKDLEVACWIPDAEMAHMLGQARQNVTGQEAWAVDPNGNKTRVLSDSAIFDAIGSEVERDMVSSYRTLSSHPIDELDPSRYVDDASNPLREEH